MPATAPLLELDHVSRRRGGRPAVADLCLALAPGEVLGLLGVNGAGKSTTLALMAGVLSPDAGTVRLGGRDLREYPAVTRRLLGWLPEHAPLYGELAVSEQLAARGRLHGLRGAALRNRIAEVLDELDLAPLARRLVRLLSQGQRQRVGLACALLHRPALLLLDEPANGLDPVQVERWRALVRRLAPQHAIVISTHVLDEVTATCNRIAILHAGRLRHVGVLAGDTRELQERFLQIATGGEAAA